MSKTLIIVESGAKCSKIEGFAGAGYKCMPSIGHLRSLTSLKDIDVSNNYTPKFNIIEGKRGQITKLTAAIKSCSNVILATDDDREGEAIAWHICKLFNLPVATTPRILFNEITKPAIQSALKNPTTINMDLVRAQQARQVLDIIVGFRLSPLLWKHISRNSKTGLSAGRCQTPALRLVYDNQKEIEGSPGKQVYNTTGYFTKLNLPFNLNYYFTLSANAEELLENSVDFDHTFSCSSPRKTTKNPPKPFSTSTIQQAANNELRCSPKVTMKELQTLYEKGLITYMRTDAKTYSSVFIGTMKEFIPKKWGDEYVHEDVDSLADRSKKKKGEKDKKTQEAHEAIRPTKIITTDVSEGYDLSPRAIKLYNLIWRNTCESCMSPAICSGITAKLPAPSDWMSDTEVLFYKYSCEMITFPGWKIVKGYDEESKDYHFLLKLKQGSVLPYNKIESKVSFRDQKLHYTEAKLVQMLEEKGIGRPSTFSSLIEKIQERKYVKKDNIQGKTITCDNYELVGDELSCIEEDKTFGNEKNKLVIQPLGILVLEFLLKGFDPLFVYDYTSKMENQLDEIAKGNGVWHEICRICDEEISQLSGGVSSEDKTRFSIDETHEYIVGKYGPVIKCTIGEDVTFKKIKKGLSLEKLRAGEYSLEEIIENKTGGGRVLGEYKGETFIIKKGKFGLYVEYGSKRSSLSQINIEEHMITLEDVIKYIEKPAGVVRVICPSISLRTGQYGHYIFIKTETMKKPRFISLKGFTEDPVTCSKSILEEWVKSKN